MLLTISLLVAIAMLYLAVFLIGHGFSILSAGLTAGNMTGIGSVVVILVMLAIVTIKVVHAVASIIYKLPEGVLNLIGLRGSDNITQDGMSHVDRSIDHAGSTGGHAIGSGVGAGQKALHTSEVHWAYFTRPIT